MKRDMDLIRDILLRIEQAPYTLGFVELEIEGRSTEEISYHIKILCQAGLVEATDLSTMGGPLWRARDLTWAGHEFLGAAKDASVWNKAKSLLINKTGGVIFEVLKPLLVEMVRAQVGLPPSS